MELIRPHSLQGSPRTNQRTGYGRDRSGVSIGCSVLAFGAIFCELLAPGGPWQRHIEAA